MGACSFEGSGAKARGTTYPAIPTNMHQDSVLSITANLWLGSSQEDQMQPGGGSA